MIDVVLALIVIGLTFAVAQDGPWNAAITFIGVLISGLLAMNLFEPVSMFLSANLMGSYDWQHYWDVISLMGIFSLSVFLFRMMGEKLLPTYAEVNTLVYELFRWGFGAAAGYTTMAIILTALHVAPLPREFFGFTPERQNLFMMCAPDRQWLALTQYVTEHALGQRDANGTPRVFDAVYASAIPAAGQPIEVWSSFPIRYAHRREAYYSAAGAASAAGGAPAGGGTTPPPSPASPTGGGAVGF